MQNNPLVAVDPDGRTAPPRSLEGCVPCRDQCAAIESAVQDRDGGPRAGVSGSSDLLDWPSKRIRRPVRSLKPNSAQRRETAALSRLKGTGRDGSLSCLAFSGIIPPTFFQWLKP